MVYSHRFLCKVMALNTVSAGPIYLCTKQAQQVAQQILKLNTSNKLANFTLDKGIKEAIKKNAQTLATV